MTENNPFAFGLIIIGNPEVWAVASTPRAIAKAGDADWRTKPRLEVHNRTSDTAGHVTAIVGPVQFSSSLSLFGSPLGAARRVLELAQVDEPVSLPHLFQAMGLT